MDLQRIVLIAAIGVVSFMLLTEWVNFRQEHHANDLAQAPITQNTQAIASSEPVVVDEGFDIPSVSNPAEHAEVPSTPANKALIQISNDVLSIKVDPRGGDIVYAALLKQKAKLDGDDPFLLLENQRRTYIAQSGLVGRNGTDKVENGKLVKPLFHSKQAVYQLAEGKDELVVDLLFAQSADVTITKRYRMRRGDYLIDVEYLVNNNSSSPWQSVFYGQIKRDESPDPSASQSGMGMKPFLGIATSTDDERFLKLKFGDIEEKNFQTTRQGGWIAMIQHYFLSAWIPDKTQAYDFSATATKSGFYLARFKGSNWTVQPGSQDSVKAQLYAGPKDQYRLEKIVDGLDLSVDYGWLWWLAQPLYALLFFFNTGTLHMFGWSQKLFGGFGNWGFSIIVLTVLVKAAFFKLNATAYKSMAKMRQFQPKMMALRERYPDDRQKQSQEMMALYKKEGVNPLGGCLPILIQMPVFISLYWVLMESVELRHAPFIGYIKDLSSMDPYFILPLIMGASMFFQQKLNPPPPDPMQAKVMQWMPVIFTFFFLFFPAGLVLYWVVNNGLSILQQYIITKQIEAANIGKS